MAVCSVEVPPEVTFADGVRVACHLYPPGSDGVPITRPTKDALVQPADPAGPGLGAGVFGDREFAAELRGESVEPVTEHSLGPGHGLTDDHSMDDIE